MTGQSSLKADPLYRDKEWLSEQYIVDKLTMEDMARQCGVDRITIRNWLIKHAIPIRSLSEAFRNRKPCSEIARCNHSTATKRMWQQGKFGGREYQQKRAAGVKLAWQRGAYGEQYTEKQAAIMRERWEKGDFEYMNSGEWAKNCKDNGVANWQSQEYREKQAHAKNNPEYRAKMRQYLETNSAMCPKFGEDNPNWKGGTTPERQALSSTANWKTVSKAIWRRDGSACQRCQKRAMGKGKRTFHIHHKASFSTAKELRLNEDNLVLLCAECHYWIHSRHNTSGSFMTRSEA